MPDTATLRIIAPDDRAPGRTRQVVAEARVGQTILEVALAHGVAIEHTCGGVGGCATCHVWVREGMEHLNPPSDEELDQVDQARDVRPDSRLSCQCRIQRPGASVVCEVPAWNRNLIREAPHGH